MRLQNPVNQKLRLFVLPVALFVTRAACAAMSPFVLKVESADSAADHRDVRVSLAIPAKHVVYAESFRVESPVAGVTVEALRMPPQETEPDPGDPSKRVAVYAHSFESLWRLKSGRPAEARLSVSYQGCSEKTCFMPETHELRWDASALAFVEAGEASPPVAASKDNAPWVPAGRALMTAGGYLSAGEFLSFLDRAEGKAAASGGNGLSRFLSDPVGFFHANGLMLTLLLVLIGGVLLNLTPCVLPMIPINLAIIGAGAGTRGRGFWLGSAYGAGIVLVYGGLGWVILKSGLFFGALQSSPWFNLAVGAVFAALTLAMFDVFVLDFGRWFPARSGGPSTGGAAAFSAGALSALLAGACVAPVVLAVLLLAGSLVAGGAPEAQFLPFVLGLGMALPWPFAGAGLSVLPAPGLWMVRVKQAFGVFLAVLAAYYFYLAAVGWTSDAHVAREGSIAAGDRAAWEAKVAQARAEGKPLFVDFWATWCKNCSAMERATFKDERVKARLSGYVVVKVQAEKPEQNPAKEMLEAFAVRGLPGFAVVK